MSIELTVAQARAVADLAEREGGVALHQLADVSARDRDGDVYVTPRGTARGYRIAEDGKATEAGEMLPAN